MQIFRTCRVGASAKCDRACRELSTVPGPQQVLLEVIIGAQCMLTGRTFQHNPQESARTSAPPYKAFRGKETIEPSWGDAAMSRADTLGGGKARAKAVNLKSKLVYMENRDELHWGRVFQGGSYTR